MTAFRSPTPENKASFIISTCDIRRPWVSVYGFPSIAGRLASGDEMLLICRQDEAVGLLQELNALTTSPAHLAHAQRMLQRLEEQIAATLGNLIGTEICPIGEEEITALVEEVDRMLSEPIRHAGVVDRLQCLLEPDIPVQNISGTAQMLNRLRHYGHSLQQSSLTGFPVRCAAGRPRTYLQGGVEHRHLTLWQYKVRRGTRQIEQNEASHLRPSQGIIL